MVFAKIGEYMVMELTEDFLKLMEIAIIVAGVLSIFFTYINYNIIVSNKGAEREAFVLGNALLSSDCLTLNNTKGLFSQEKIELMVRDSSCFKYPYGVVEISVVDGSIPPWEFSLGGLKLGGEAEFLVLIKLNNNKNKIARMVVKV